jgi:hypothetical protein
MAVVEDWCADRAAQFAVIGAGAGRRSLAQFPETLVPAMLLLPQFVGVRSSPFLETFI